jgi:endo-1,4-beta-xylanase
MSKKSLRFSKFTKVSLILVSAVFLTVFLFNSFIINAATPTGTRLKDIQDEVLIGTEFPSDFNTMSDSSTFLEVAKPEFNIVTAENAMKWDTTEPSQDSFNFTSGDALASWAESNGCQLHGHTLVWHNQTPSWVQSLSASEMQEAMYNHIDNVMEHYKGNVLVWDVVNEAFDDSGNYRTSFWYNTLGETYIENAFTRARNADPDAKLIYNDYNLEYTGSKSDAVYNMLKDFKSRGIPIDGIGFQMHLDILYGFDYEDFASNMQRFADLGLDIYITEMDVRISSSPTSEELQTQADYYEGVIEKCMEQSAVKAIQFWGFTDKYSWIPQTFSGRGAALLFDEDYNPKLSYYAVQSALMGDSSTTSDTTTTATSTATTTTTPTATSTQSDEGDIELTYVISNDWGSGATIAVNIENASSSTIDGWELTWNFLGNEEITNLWNGSYSQNGTSVTVNDAGYNSNIPEDGSVSFGFNLTYTGENTKPTEFILNGVNCVVQ